MTVYIPMYVYINIYIYIYDVQHICICTYIWVCTTFQQNLCNCLNFPLFSYTLALFFQLESERNMQINFITKKAVAGNGKKSLHFKKVRNYFFQIIKLTF